MNYKMLLYAVFGLVLLMNVGFAADVACVDPDGTCAGVTCFSSGLYAPAYPDLATAVTDLNNFGSPGDTIYVCDHPVTGPVFESSGVIQVTVPVNIVAEPATVPALSNAHVDFLGGGPGNMPFIYILANDTNISGFSLLDFTTTNAAEIWVDASNVSVYNNHIRDPALVGVLPPGPPFGATYGIAVSSTFVPVTASGNNIYNNMIWESQEACIGVGVTAPLGFPTGPADENTIRNNTGTLCGMNPGIYGPGTGFFAINGANNIFDNNTANQATTVGFLEWGGCVANTFTDNRALDNQYGFAVDSQGVTTMDSVYQNNLVLDTPAGPAVDWGYFVISSPNPTTNIQFIDNVANDSSGPGMVGFYDASTSNNTFTSNEVYDAQYGFELDGSGWPDGASGNTLTDNIVMDTGSGNLQGGFYLHDGAADNLLQGNEVYDSTQYGIYVRDSPDNSFISNEMYDTLTEEGIYARNSPRCIFNMNTILTTGDYGIYLWQSDNVTAEGNVVNDTPNDGIGINNCDNTVLEENTVTNPDNHGIHFLNSDGFTTNENVVQDVPTGRGYFVDGCADFAMAGDIADNVASAASFYIDGGSTGTMSNCRATNVGSIELNIQGGSNVSTGSFFIGDLIKVVFSNAVDIRMNGSTEADSGVDPTANCTDEVNFPDCVLVTPNNNVVRILGNSPGEHIDLGIVFDESKVVALGYTIDQLGIAEWDGVSDWIFLGQNDSDDWGRWVKRDGIDSFSYFGVVRFGDPSITVDGGKKSDKELDIDYEVLCPEKKVEVTVEHGSEPVSGVEVSLLMGLVVDEDTTDSDGKVTFDLSEAGDYELRASKSGYRRDEASFEFDMCGEEPEEEVPPTVEEPAEEEVEPAPEPEEEEVTETADAMNEAEQALSDAQAAIDTAKAEGKDTTEAEAKLREAEEKFQMEDFAAAKQLAEEAKALLEAAAPAAPEEEAPPTEEEEPAPVAEPEEEPEPEADYSWVLWLVVIVIIVGAGYWYFTQPKKKK